jgi:murein DD-endopeptidase MepM/ murein hydrolase activator NlpD
MGLGGLLLLLALNMTTFSAPIAQAQINAPCGIVDTIGYPVDLLYEETIATGYDDFALFRSRFGGNHAGIDIAFDRQGDPVYAVARGRVTYADPEGWDTEKGVVIVEHYFPDESRYFSLYGHVEQTDSIRLPLVGACVEAGDVIAAVGWPSRGAPHLHYEIRTFLPDDGGPGYTEGNPLEEGWLHPLDFTALWQARLTPGFVDALTYPVVPSVAPVYSGGQMVVAYENLLRGVFSPDVTAWQVSTDGAIDGLAALPGGQVVAHTVNGQVVVLANGRYVAVWSVAALAEPFIALGEMLIFALPGGALAAYTPDGQPIWSLPAISDPGARVYYYGSDHVDQVAIAMRGEDTIALLIADIAGNIRYQAEYDENPVIAPGSAGRWHLAYANRVWRVVEGQALPVAAIGQSPGRIARLTVDAPGNIYLYLGDSDHTLVSWDATGALRWRSNYPSRSGGLLPPLVRTDQACLLYVLDLDGRLNLLNAQDGSLMRQIDLYAGGTLNRQPSARVLAVEPDGQVRVHTGFLSSITFDGRALGAAALADCVLG